MTATITVRGSHTALFDAERATLSLSAGFQGPDRKDVFARATSLAAEIAALITPHLDADAGPVTRWAADRVHVWSERPWNTEGKRLPLVYHASLGARAEFSDFDVLGRVIEQLAVVEGVTIGGIDWDLTRARRDELTEEVRVAAVADAVRKAGAYAQAAGLGSPAVTAVADPGMLGDSSSGDSAPQYERAMFAARGAADSGGAPLTLTPEQIQLSCSVDARFTA